jgi:hypothetical protein
VTSVVAQARRCRGGTCAYRTVARGRTAGLRLAAGLYRVTVTASGPGGQARKTFGVTVRGR